MLHVSGDDGVSNELSQSLALSNTFATTGSALPAESRISCPGPGYATFAGPGAPSAGYSTMYAGTPVPIVTDIESGVAPVSDTFIHACPVSLGAMSQLIDEPGAAVAFCKPAVADQFAFTYSHPWPSDRRPCTLSVVSMSIVMPRFVITVESRTTIRKAV